MTVDTRLTLGQLTESQLVRRTDDIDLSYLFKHGLTQETAYGSLLKTHRRDIHRAVASAMEQTYADRLDESGAPDLLPECAARLDVRAKR